MEKNCDISIFDSKEEILELENNINDLNIEYYSKIINKLEKIHKSLSKKREILMKTKNKTENNIIPTIYIGSVFSLGTIVFIILSFNFNSILVGFITFLAGVSCLTHIIIDDIKNEKKHKKTLIDLSLINKEIINLEKEINKNKELLKESIEIKITKDSLSSYFNKKSELIKIKEYLIKFLEGLNLRQKQVLAYEKNNINLNTLELFEKCELIKLKNYIKDDNVKRKTLLYNDYR